VESSGTCIALVSSHPTKLAANPFTKKRYTQSASAEPDPERDKVYRARMKLEGEGRWIRF